MSSQIYVYNLNFFRTIKSRIKGLERDDTHRNKQTEKLVFFKPGTQ